MEGENQPGGEAKKKKWLEYGAIAAGGLVIAIVIMKRGSTAATTTQAATDPNAGMPIVVPASSGGSSSTGTDPTMTTALTNLLAGQQAQTDAETQAFQSMQSQNAASLAALQSLINRPAQVATAPTVSSYGTNAPGIVSTYPSNASSYPTVSQAVGGISTIVGVQSTASVIALGGNAVQSNNQTSTYVTNNPNPGQVNVTTVNNTNFANAKPESAMTGGSYSIVNYGGKTYNVDNATGQAYTG